MKIIQGDKDRLEGKAIIYSKVCEKGQTEFVNAIVKTSLLDFINSINPFGGPFGERERAQIYMKCMFNDPSAIEAEKEGIPIYGYFADWKYDLENGKDAEKIRKIAFRDTDIWYVGEHPAKHIAKDVIKSYVNFYNSTFAEQQKKPDGFFDQFLKSPNLSSSFRENLIAKATNLADALFFNRKKEARQITEDIVKMHKSEWFFSNVYEMVSKIRNIDKNRGRIIELYADKMDAIRSENYEKASILTQEINKLGK